MGKGRGPEKKLKQAQDLPVENVKLTPKSSQDLEDIWYYGYHHFGEVRAERYINQFSGSFLFLGNHNIGTSSS